MERPTFCTEDHLEFLDNLRGSGETNMFGSLPYLEAEFNLVRPVAREILEYWIKSFGDETR
jgi:hypothetical protein